MSSPIGPAEPAAAGLARLRWPRQSPALPHDCQWAIGRSVPTCASSCTTRLRHWPCRLLNVCRILNCATTHDRTAAHSTIEIELCIFAVAILDVLSLPRLLCCFHLGQTGSSYCPGAMVKAARRDATNRYTAEQELLSTFRTSRGTFLDDQLWGPIVINAN